MKEPQDFNKLPALPFVDSSSASSGLLVKEGCVSLGTSHVESSFGGSEEVDSWFPSEVRSMACTSAGAR